MTEEIDPRVLNLQLLSKMVKKLDSIEKATKEQTPIGEVFPLVVPIAVATPVEIDPGVGVWRSVSIFNRGPHDCEVQLNKSSLLLARPIPIGARVSKDFEYLTEVIGKVYARCAVGDNAVLELEFKR